MADYKLQKPLYLSEKRANFLLPTAALWGAALIFIFGYFLYDNGLESNGTRYYLIPWALLTGAVIAAPSVYLYFTKQFHFYHPLVFVAWAYFFPAFCIGGLILASGYSNPYYLIYVQNEHYDLPLTLFYVMLGYGSLSVGFFLPFGRKIGEIISRRLPVLDWEVEKLYLPGLLLLGLGLANIILAFSVGLIGFQKVEEVGIFDGVIFLLTFFWLESAFLLWLCIFRTSRLTFNNYLLIVILIATSLGKSAFQGNRGSLVQIFILIVFAFLLSGKKILLKHKIGGGIIFFAAIFFGMIYGTTFRTVKTTENQVSMDEYASNVFETFEKLTDQDIGANLEIGFWALSERVENVSQLAVVVSNYETLSVYEASYNLDNNILKDSVAFLIPRFLWQDKPVATDPYKIGDLYFNYGENSFTLTPMGDLLRNFGPWGIPVGMIFLGFLIRILYAGLIEGQAFSFWRATMYFMLFTGISFEGSFGLIIPYDIKIGLVSALGLFIVWFFVGKLNFDSSRVKRS